MAGVGSKLDPLERVRIHAPTSSSGDPPSSPPESDVGSPTPSSPKKPPERASPRKPRGRRPKVLVRSSLQEVEDPVYEILETRTVYRQGQRILLKPGKRVSKGSHGEAFLQILEKIGVSMRRI